MTKWSRAVLTMMLAGMLPAAGAWADSDPSNDLDSLTVSVTPNVDYSITLSTDNAALALGAVDLGQSSYTARPSTITFGGTIASGHEVIVDARVTSPGGTPWTFSNTPSTGTAQGQDQLSAFLLFTSTMQAGAPAAALFGDPSGGTSGGTNAAFTGGTSVFAGVHAGGLGGPGVKFELTQAGVGQKQMDDIVIGSGGTNSEKAHIWAFLRLPSATSASAMQYVQVTMTHALGAN